LQGRLEGLLVSLDRHEVIAPLFEEDLLTGLDLGVRGVAQDDLASHLQAAEQLARRRDLVALRLGDHAAQKLPRATGSIDHLHAAMTHFLTVDDH
jgi:hypothetical protein